MTLTVECACRRANECERATRRLSAYLPYLYVRSAVRIYSYMRYASADFIYACSFEGFGDNLRLTKDPPSTLPAIVQVVNSVLVVETWLV